MTTLAEEARNALASLRVSFKAILTASSKIRMRGFLFVPIAEWRKRTVRHFYLVP